MLGADFLRFFAGRSQQCSPGQVVGFTEQTAGTLMDGGDRLIIEGGVFEPCDSQVVGQIALHSLSVDLLQVASGDDA